MKSFYTLSILLCYNDLSEGDSFINELNILCIQKGLTFFLVNHLQEAARYIDSFKVFS